MKNSGMNQLIKFDLDTIISSFFSKISRQDKISLAGIILIALFAHGAAMTDFFINEDVHISGYNDLLGSGRFLFGPAFDLTGSFPFYFLQVALFILLVSVSGLLIANLLKVESIPVKILLGGVLVTYPAYSVGITYGFAILNYALATFFSVTSVYLVSKKSRFGYIAGILCLVCSLGIYQAFLSISAALCCAIIFMEFLAVKEFCKTTILPLLRKTLFFASYGIASGIVYYVTVKFLVWSTDSQLDSYKGASSLGAVDISINLLSKINVAYESLFDGRFFLFPDYVPLSLKILGALGACVLVLNVVSKKNFLDKVYSLFIISVLLCVLFVMAFAVSIVAPYALINRMQTYGVVVLICFLISVVARDSSVFKSCAILVGSVLVLGFIVRCNAQYYKASLVTRGSFLTVNRIFSKIEDVPGYNSNFKIAIIGALPNSNLHSSITPPFNEQSSGYSGNFVGLSRLNQSYKFSKLMEYLGYDIKAITEPDEYLRASKASLDMPLYPAKGSVKAVGDMVVVKLREPVQRVSVYPLGGKKYRFEYTPLSDSTHLEFGWIIVDANTGKQTFLRSRIPVAEYVFDKAGDPKCVIGVYREAGSSQEFKTHPECFIVTP